MSEIARTVGKAKTPVRASRVGACALLVGLLSFGLLATGCSAQQEVVRMPELTGLPIQPIPLPPPATVMTVSQKNAAIAQMQAAGKKNTTLAN